MSDTAWTNWLLGIGWILAFIEPTPIGEAGMTAITGAWFTLGLLEDDGS